MTLRHGAVALVLATLGAVLPLGCTKSPPAGNAVAGVAQGTWHGSDNDLGARSLLARIGPRDEGLSAASLYLEGHSLPASEGCPDGMANVDGRFCIDRYEASLVEVLPNGDERPYAPFETVEGRVVRAVSSRGVFPQGYISEVQAKDACARSGKRLCKPAEWRNACMGPKHTVFGYGNARVTGRCNDNGRSPMLSVLRMRTTHPSEWTHDRMNDPRLNQAPHTLARAGEHEECTNGYGVYDMVGNLHEWVDDPAGTFQGGYYLDTHINGDGCNYRTVAHASAYHDYSTGFRCCADPQ